MSNSTLETSFFGMQPVLNWH